MPEPTSDLREQLRAAIDAAGLHQVTIARDLGISQKHLCAMLTGRARLTLEWADRIAEACWREVVAAVAVPDGDLRERLREALTREHHRRARKRIEASPEEHCAGFADAVLPVVQDETAALRQRAEEAERERDDYRQRFANQMTAATELTTTLREAERKLQQALEAIADERRGRLAAEAAVRRAREKDGT